MIINEHINEVVDDLTESICADCGTPHELTRPISLLLNGEYFGEIVCVDCELTRMKHGG